jgi:hypothetical protein
VPTQHEPKVDDGALSAWKIGISDSDIEEIEAMRMAISIVAEELQDPQVRAVFNFLSDLIQVQEVKLRRTLARVHEVEEQGLDVQAWIEKIGPMIRGAMT